MMSNKPAVPREFIKTCREMSAEDSPELMKLDLEIHKKLLNIFHVDDFYYLIFDVKEVKFDFISSGIEKMLGYKADQVDVPFFLSLIHPEDQPYFLQFENQNTIFFSTLTPDQVPNYKVRYDYRIKKHNGAYIRLLQQTVTIQFNDKGAVLKTLVVHTDISHFKPEGKPLLSYIGMNGEPSYIDVNPEGALLPVGCNLLSKREQHVLALLVAGRKSKEIANELNISVDTVTTHRKNMLRKTNLQNTVELVTMAIRKGWV